MNDIKTNLSHTIDLQGIIQAENEQYYIEKGYLKKESHKKDIIMAIIGAVITIISLTLTFIPNHKTNANYEPVLTMQDKIRLERLQVCQDEIKKAGIAKNQLELQKLVIKCSLRMHGVYVVESAIGKTEVRKNNFLGIKRTVNGYYGFNSFKNGTDCRIYFAKKYAEFHYKKSPRTFIYGFWIDGKWQYGWSISDKDSYTKTLQRIENNQELKIQYEYLYFSN